MSNHSHITPGDRVSIPYGITGGRRTGTYLEDLGLGWIRVELEQTHERVPALASQTRQVTVSEELEDDVLDAVARASETVAREYEAAGILEMDHRGDPRKSTITPPDELARLWSTMHPKTRRRIERASRPLVLLLDAYVVRDRESKSR